MKVSVVIPAYNAAAFLVQTLDSILTQTLADWEVVIVDDGSSDSTADIAQDYSRRDPRIRFVCQSNQGTALARNRGFSETNAECPYVTFLDHDDVWEHKTLEVLAQTLDSQPEAVAAHGLSRAIDAAGDMCHPGFLETWGRGRDGVDGKRLVPWPVQKPTTLAVLAVRNYIYTPGQLLIRRRVLEAIGPFDPLTSPCDDWDMTLRLTLRGYIAYVDRVLLNWRLHSRNEVRNNVRVDSQQLYVRRKLLNSSDLTNEQRRIIRTANRHWSRMEIAARLSRARYDLSRGRIREGLRSVGGALKGYSGRV